jgi:hypothetical protein
VILEVLGKLKKKSNDLIENRTRHLPPCSIVPQPTTLLRAPNNNNNNNNTLITNKAQNKLFKYKKGGNSVPPVLSRNRLIQKHASKIPDVNETTQHTNYQLHKNAGFNVTNM